MPAKPVSAAWQAIFQAGEMPDFRHVIEGPAIRIDAALYGH
jgi:hypothetical protein